MSSLKSAVKRARLNSYVDAAVPDFFYSLPVGDPLIADVASPKDEQAKTDTNRIKIGLVELRQSWQVENR